jgi:hypothetical protein
MCSPLALLGLRVILCSQVMCNVKNSKVGTRLAKPRLAPTMRRHHRYVGILRNLIFLNYRGGESVAEAGIIKLPAGETV